MALPALLLAGGKLGLKLLPAIGAVAGAQPGLRRGNLGEAALGAGLTEQFSAACAASNSSALTPLSIFMEGIIGKITT